MDGLTAISFSYCFASATRAQKNELPDIILLKVRIPLSHSILTKKQRKTSDKNDYNYM